MCFVDHTCDVCNKVFIYNNIQTVYFLSALVTSGGYF